MVGRGCLSSCAEGASPFLMIPTVGMKRLGILRWFLIRAPIAGQFRIGDHFHVGNESPRCSVRECCVRVLESVGGCTSFNSHRGNAMAERAFILLLPGKSQADPVVAYYNGRNDTARCPACGFSSLLRGLAGPTMGMDRPGGRLVDLVRGSWARRARHVAYSHRGNGMVKRPFTISCSGSRAGRRPACRSFPWWEWISPVPGSLISALINGLDGNCTPLIPTVGMGWLSAISWFRAQAGGLATYRSFPRWEWIALRSCVWFQFIVPWPDRFLDGCRYHDGNEPPRWPSRRSGARFMG